MQEKEKIARRLAKENGTDLYPLPDRLHADGNGKSGRYDRRNGKYLQQGRGIREERNERSHAYRDFNDEGKKRNPAGSTGKNKGIYRKERSQTAWKH